MKKLTLILALATLFQVAYAQVETETHHNKNILGGGFSFYTSNNDIFYLSPIIAFSNTDSKTTSFGFSPYFGREITTHTTLGLKVNYNNMNIKKYKNRYSQPQHNSKISSNELGIGIFARYTFNPENVANLFVEPYFSYNKVNSKNKNENILTREYDVNYVRLGIDAGVLYNVSKIIRVSLRIGVADYVNGSRMLSSQHNDNESNDFSHFSTALNLSNVFFGFEIKL